MPNTSFINSDVYYMKRALELSYFSKGTTSPNPTVAAILVNKEGKIISTGVTKAWGGFHAERMALKDISVNDTEGCTLYVTLEPCCFTGRTPACTEIIIEKKIKRVVVATGDPNPKVSGKGLAILKENGIEITFGILQKEANNINADFFLAQTKNRPLVFLKYASSLDGFITPKNSQGQYILSNKRALKLVHLLRFRADAILVGANTVIKDNPSLTVRFTLNTKHLLRVVLDEDLKIPLDCTVLKDEFPTIVVTNKWSYEKNSSFIKTLKDRKNKEIFIGDPNGNLNTLLTYLYKEKNILSLMVEGGAGVLASFLEQKLADKAFIFYNNKFLGKGLSPFCGNFFDDEGKNTPQLQIEKIKKLESNFLVYGNILWQ